MSRNNNDKAFKRIELVWIWNLLPPASGFGTLYGAGESSFLLVVLAWIFLYHQQFSLVAFGFVYLFLSLIGTGGVVINNRYLAFNQENNEKTRELQHEKSSQSFALDSFEKKVKELDSKAQKKSVVEIQLSSQEPDAIPALEEVDTELSSSSWQDLSVDQDIFLVDSDETRDVEPVCESGEEMTQYEKVDPVLENFSQPADEIKSSKEAEDSQLVEERTRLLEKLGKATGEFQPELIKLDEPLAYDFCNFDNFKFEPEINIIPVIENLEEDQTCIECGAKRDYNFSFCLSCGKNVV